MELKDIEDWGKRRGIFYPSCEIYGGLSGIYDYGPVGAGMKKNFENLWKEFFLSLSDNYFEIDSSLIMSEPVFVASGHIENFIDPIVKCKKCGRMEKADQLIATKIKGDFDGLSEKQLNELIAKHKIKCPSCSGELSEVGKMNLMFSFPFGPMSQEKAYLRPETAQGPYVNFLRAFQSMRKKLPMGLAVIGKAFRNEISPRQLIVRQREFTQAELQIFFDPAKIDEFEKWDEIKDYELIVLFADERKTGAKKIKAKKMAKKLPKFYVAHLVYVQKFYLNVLGLSEKKFRLKELIGDEKAFYNKYHWDVEFYFESLKEYKEIGGVHYRTDHDLSGHQKISKTSHEIFWDGKKILPHVLELSFGVDRSLLAIIDNGWKKEGDRFFLSVNPKISFNSVSVFPLVSKDKVDDKAKEIYERLKERMKGVRIFYDDAGSIGKRYARADEIGTPIDVTIDYQTLKDNTVTLRDRDTTKQIRVSVDKLESVIHKILEGEKLEKFGEFI